MAQSRKGRFYLFGAVLLLLFVALGAQFFFMNRGGEGGGLTEIPADWMPQHFPGWTVEDLEYAQTQAAAAAVSENIGYSAYLYRRYTDGSRVIFVDITYWPSGTRHFLDVGTHVPDNCWIAAGWELREKLPTRVITVQGKSLIPAEERVFNNGALSLRSLYWHLLDGERVDYARYGTGKTMGFIWDNKGRYLDGQGEQFFINIMASMSFEELQREPLFRAIMADLVKHFPVVDSAEK